jgi:NAD(P)-dependent dehydrogenase (short-subunit alcohol dehydrogenase family)
VADRPLRSNANRLALVTGTSTGIGAAVAAPLLDAGWRVVGVARRPGAIAHSRYTHLAVDLGEVDSLRVIEDEIASILRHQSVRRVGLVNNAAAPGPLAPTEDVSPNDLLQLCAVNVVAPFSLMGIVVRQAPPDAAVRIVNVSSGAAVAAYPGLGPYSASKAALRMAGMVLAAELGSPKRERPRPDIAILSYEPGAVDTGMQVYARSLGRDAFPWVDMFHAFVERKMLVPPAAPAAEIVKFLESDGHPGFSEARFGR